jgi:hypothetical protein
MKSEAPPHPGARILQWNLISTSIHHRVQQIKTVENGLLPAFQTSNSTLFWLDRHTLPPAPLSHIHRTTFILWIIIINYISTPVPVWLQENYTDKVALVKHLVE